MSARAKIPDLPKTGIPAARDNSGFLPEEKGETESPVQRMRGKILLKNPDLTGRIIFDPTLEQA